MTASTYRSTALWHPRRELAGFYQYCEKPEVNLPALLLKLSNFGPAHSTWMGDRQGTLGAVDTFCYSFCSHCKMNQQKSGDSTECSQAVSHPSADRTRYGLTSVILECRILSTAPSVPIMDEFGWEFV